MKNFLMCPDFKRKEIMIKLIVMALKLFTVSNVVTSELMSESAGALPFNKDAVVMQNLNYFIYSGCRPSRRYS